MLFQLIKANVLAILSRAISREFIKQIHFVEFKFKQISQIATELAHPSVDYVTMTLTILAMFATRRQKLYNSSKYDVSWMYLLPISDRLQTLIPVMGVVCLLSSSVCKHVCACLLAAQLPSGKVETGMGWLRVDAQIEITST